MFLIFKRIILSLISNSRYLIAAMALLMISCSSNDEENLPAMNYLLVLNGGMVHSMMMTTKMLHQKTLQ